VQLEAGHPLLVAEEQTALCVDAVRGRRCSSSVLAVLHSFLDLAQTTNDFLDGDVVDVEEGLNGDRDLRQIVGDDLK
jgi:hypothetical protein